MNTYLAPPATLSDKIGAALAGIRDWLDARGKVAWVVAMIAGFVLVWPVGLAILGYMIWSKRMFSCRNKHSHFNNRRFGNRHFSASSGNTAFDAYRDETLKRLEDEHSEFLAFLEKLREAKDKAEFDQFMDGRRNSPAEVQN